jgi:hypothetical protein
VKRKKPRSSKKPKKEHVHTRQKAIDTFPSAERNLTGKTRGRPRKLPWDTVTGRASNYEYQLGEVWGRLQAPLLGGQTADQITAVFQEFAQPYAAEFVPRLSSDILSLLNDPDFPQRAIPRIKFLARSLAGRPNLSFRTSRDICEEAATQEKLKSPHRILRREFYVECSCGYKGPAFDNNCRNCGAESPLSIDVWTGQAPWNPSDERIPKATRHESNQEVEVPRTAESDNVHRECGTAATHEGALEALAEHKRLVHEIEQEKKEK